MYDGVVVHQRSGYNAVADDADICAETDSQVVVVFACDHVLGKGSCVGFHEFGPPTPAPQSVDGVATDELEQEGLEG